MLLRLSVNKLPLSGYVNVDPAPAIEEDKVHNFNIKPIDFRNMDIFDIVKDAECEEILCDNVLEYVKFADLHSFLSYLLRKLRKFGKIYLTGFDNTEVCRQYYNEEINEQDFNAIMFGTGEHPWAYKNGAHSMLTIIKILESLKLKIISYKCNNGLFFIEGERI